MSTVIELQPGDLVVLPGAEVTGVFITGCRHPLYGLLRLVVWRLSDGSWSFDALSELQDIGHIQPTTPGERFARLKEACER